MSAPLYTGGPKDKDQPVRLDWYWRLRQPPAPRERSMPDYHILHTQYRVTDFVGWQRNGILQLNPNFQRRSVWKKGAKSYLIDTIVRGISMPIVFLRDLPADIHTLQSKRDVVDGQQRLRTVLAYVDPTLLPDFDPTRDDFRIDPTHNPQLGGKTFSQLSREDKQRILDYQLSVHVFPADTDDRDILQVFARMNATGTNLNGQELRNAEFFGRFKTLSYEIATEQLNRWRDLWHIFTPDQIARMNEVELTSEFMLVIMEGVLEKSNTIINAFYRDFDEKFTDSSEVASRFRGTMDTISSAFTDEHVADLFSNRTMFFALFAATYGLQFGLRSPMEGISNPVKGRLLQGHMPVTKQLPRAIPQTIINQILRAAGAIKSRQVPDEVLRSVRGATTHASSRRIVIRHLVGDDNDPCPPLH
jgi:hypothetical protein